MVIELPTRITSYLTQLPFRYMQMELGEREPHLNTVFALLTEQFALLVSRKENQSIVYNGHKRVPAIKFQSVTTLNGLIANVYGPVGKHAFYPINENMIVAFLLAITIIVITFSPL